MWWLNCIYTWEFNRYLLLLTSCEVECKRRSWIFSRASFCLVNFCLASTISVGLCRAFCKSLTRASTILLLTTLELFFGNIFLLFNFLLTGCLFKAFNRFILAALLAAARRRRLRGPDCKALERLKLQFYQSIVKFSDTRFTQHIFYIAPDRRVNQQKI